MLIRRILRLKQMARQRTLNKKAVKAVLGEENKTLAQQLTDGDTQALAIAYLRDKANLPTFDDFKNDIKTMYHQGYQLEQKNNPNISNLWPSLAPSLDQNQTQYNEALRRGYRHVLQERALIRMQQVLNTHLAHPKNENGPSAEIDAVAQAMEEAVHTMALNELEQLGNAKNNRQAMDIVWDYMKRQPAPTVNGQPMNRAELNGIETQFKAAAEKNRGYSPAQLRNLVRQGSQRAGMIVFRVWNYLAAPDRYDYNPDPNRGNLLDQSTEAKRAQRAEAKAHYHEQKLALKESNNEQAHERSDVQRQANTPRPSPFKHD